MVSLNCISKNKTQNIFQTCGVHKHAKVGQLVILAHEVKVIGKYTLKLKNLCL
jgi:hypothetical protein